MAVVSIFRPKNAQACLHVFKPIAIDLVCANPSLQQWCICKMVSGETRFAVEDASPGIDMAESLQKRKVNASLRLCC